MNVPVPPPVAFRPVVAKVAQSSEKPELEKVINVTFMTMMESPDLSCVYRVRLGDTARSIVTMALKRRLGRDPIADEIESYLLEVKELNQNQVERLKAGDIFLLPIDHEHALGHHVRKAWPTADVSRRVIETANCPKPANVQLVIAPPGLSAAPGSCIKGDGIIASRISSQPDVDEINATVTYNYHGELSSSFLGLFRSFFVASETRNSLGQLLSSSIEYDGFGTSLKFMTIAGIIELSLVRSIKTRYDHTSNLYETIVTYADEMRHTLVSSPDGTRSWRV